MDKNVKTRHIGSVLRGSKKKKKKKLLNNNKSTKIKHVGQRPKKKKVTVPEAFERKYVFRVSDKAIA